MSAISAIHVAKKQLGLDDDTYRSMLKVVTGKTSARDMTPAEQHAVVQELRRRGFKPGKKGLEGPFARKLQALWIAAWNLGIVRDRKDSAMLAFIRRQTGIDHTRFLLDAEDADKAIEALKSWMNREAGVDWSVTRLMPLWQRQPGFRIAVAQWNILVARVDMRGKTFQAFVEDHAFNPIDRMTPKEWTGVMNTLGSRIRKAVR
ncbi:MAG: regulatory protein GemA [Rhizobiaceae bacterium]|nr:regulatory protein GemA [Rhizobiaceae bacterium]